MIDRYLIRYFLAVVEQGNFSRAAAHCNVSQPTLSVGIAKLEKAITRKLFMRTNQRVELTEAGTRFLPQARKIEHAFNSALASLSNMPAADRQRPFRLGILHSISGLLIARAAGGAHVVNPSAIEFTFASERDLLGRLTTGRLDALFTIIRPAIREFESRDVIEEGYAMIFSGNHPTARRKSVRAEDLASEPMIVRRHCEILSETSRHFLDRGVRPHFSMRTTNDERAQDMVRAGMGITVMPESYRAQGLRQVRLVDFEQRRTLGFYIADRNQADHPMLDAIATVFQQAANSS